MKTVVVILLSCLAAVLANAASAVGLGHGVLCLTFDDSRFSDWEEALPIFERHGAHATFFAYHKIDEKSVASLRRLSGAGHSIGLHGLKHQLAPDIVAKLGEDGYIADEVEPQLSVCRAVGLPVRSFAYPCSRHTSQTDALLLRHFSRLRGGGDFKGAFPVSEAATRRYLPGLGIGPKYKRGGAEVASMLPAGIQVRFENAADIHDSRRQGQPFVNGVGASLFGTAQEKHSCAAFCLGQCGSWAW